MKKALSAFVCFVVLSGCSISDMGKKFTDSISASSKKKEAPVQKSEPTKDIALNPVFIQASFTSGFPILSVMTNLPDGFKTIVHVRDASTFPPKIKREELTVNNGGFDIYLLWMEKQPYEMKNVSVHIGSPPVSTMSESIQKLLGSKGEKLYGQNISSVGSEKVLDYSISI